jgi:hypothetical protein
MPLISFALQTLSGTNARSKLFSDKVRERRTDQVNDELHGEHGQEEIVEIVDQRFE